MKTLLCLSEAIIIVVATVTDIAKYIILLFATHGWEMYLGLVVTIFSGLFGAMCRSILSQMVDNNEIGKVFAFATASESLIGLIASPIYTLVYNATLHIFPGAFFGISIIVLVMILVISL